MSRSSHRLPFHRRFAVRLAAAILALAAAVLTISAFTAVRIAGDGFDRVVRADFQSTLGFTENFIASEARSWVDWVHHLTEDESDHGLGMVVKHRDRALLKVYLHEKLPSGFSGAATITDINGRVLHRTHLPGEFGDSLGHVDIVRRALSGGAIDFAIVNDLNQFILYAAGPIREQGAVVGTLLIGTPVDDAFVELIKANTGVDLAVIRDRAVMGSTIKTAEGVAVGDLPVPYLEYQMMLSKPEQVRETRLFGTRFFIATRKIAVMDSNTPGSLLLAVPRQILDEEESEIYRQFAILLGLLLLLTVVVSAALSRGMSRRIGELTDKVDSITADGHYEPLSVSSNDEIAILADRFNRMQEKLAETNRALRAHSQTLELRVKERTAELQLVNAEHKMAKEAAEEANRSKSQFLSSMSHELRTPLNAILGFGQLLALDAETDPDDERREAVDQILKSGEHLLALVNEVLDLARIESGRMELKIEAVDARTALKQCLTMTEAMAAKTGVSVSPLTLPDDFPPLMVDPMRFKQVMLNLLSNAVKYNRPGGSVEILCKPGREGCVQLGVKDTGEGLSLDQVDKLFIPFERLGREASDIEGTGIGLDITKKLVELMGGRIGVDSAKGEGSTFWIGLPLAEESAAKADEAANGAADSARQPQTTTAAANEDVGVEGASVVVYVEDNPANIMLMEKVFAKSPTLTLHTAPDAEVGLALIRDARPDLVLMDLHLPGMSGIEALAELRKDGETAAIPVLAISADVIAENVDNAMDAGFDGYISKPFKLSEIADKISQAIAAKR